MDDEKKRTKTERRVLQALYRLQTHGQMSAGKLGTYETLMRETLASRSALLSTCQRLAKEGAIIRGKINAANRKRWPRQWPVGYPKRQAHYILSPEMLAAMEAGEDLQDWLDEDIRRQRAEDRAGRGSQMSNGPYLPFR